MGVILDYILPFLGILTVLVFVHELGHYLLARWNGVRVETFSIGFGPELFGWNDRHGTRWRISALPLGGYVKMFGDSDASSSRPDDRPMTEEEKAVSFHHKRLGQRASIVAAGPLANFLFAILLLAGLYMTVGQPTTAPQINDITANSPAAAAGLQKGDEVLAIDGVAVARFEEMQRLIQARPGQTVAIDVRRGDETVTLTATLAEQVVTDRLGGEQRIGQLGVRSIQGKVVQHGPVTAVTEAARETWSITVGTVHAIGQMISGQRDTKELGGVIRIAQMSGEVTREGIVYVIWFAALLSINLGLINLMPLPVLDGGHLLFYAAEAIYGRPLGRKIQEYGAAVGLTAILALMVFATWNDLVQLRAVHWVSSLFG